MSENSEKFSVREFVAVVAGPKGWGETRESWLARAARRAGISYRQTKALFYGEITDPEHRAARRMKAAAEQDGQREAKQLADHFERIARSIDAAAGQNFYREDVAALVRAARILRGLDRAGTGGGAE